MRLWDAESGGELFVGREHTSQVNAVAFHASGKQLASGGADGTIRLWDSEGKQTHKLTVGISGRLHSVAYTADGNAVVAAGSAKTWQLFNRDSALLLRTVEGHNHTIYRLALNPAGNRVATLDASGKFFIWDTATGGVLFHQQLPASAAFNLAYAPDGTELSAATQDPRVLRVTIPPAAR